MDPGFRLAIHQLADRVLEAALGVGGTAATRVLFVMDGKVYSIDQDGADQKLVSSSDHQAMSPAWAADGRRFSRSEEHTSELQSQSNLVCRLLLEKKKNE